MCPKLRVPPIEYTALAIAIHTQKLDDAAVVLLTMAANNIAAKEALPRVQPPAQAQARRPARQHQRR